MKYSKPELLAVEVALNAIQGGTEKTGAPVEDIFLNLSVPPAYEVDE